MSLSATATFFSYCRDDSDFALRLAEDLKAAGEGVGRGQRAGVADPARPQRLCDQRGLEPGRQAAGDGEWGPDGEDLVTQHCHAGRAGRSCLLSFGGGGSFPSSGWKRHALAWRNRPRKDSGFSLGSPTHALPFAASCLFPIRVHLCKSAVDSFSFLPTLGKSLVTLVFPPSLFFLHFLCRCVTPDSGDPRQKARVALCSLKTIS